MTGRRHRKTGMIVAIVIAVIIVTRLTLPYVILRYANNSLEEMDGYRGHVNDIDLAILRGAYKRDSIYINKIDPATDKETPFLAASLVDLSIEWKALFRGSLVGWSLRLQKISRFCFVP